MMNNIWCYDAQVTWDYVEHSEDDSAYMLIKLNK